MCISVIGFIDDSGKFSPNSKELFKKTFEQFKGKRVELTVKQWHKTRSNSQNAYYWGVVIEMITFAINDLGNEFDKDTIHEYLKGLFLKTTKEIIDNSTGLVTEIAYIKSTTKLTTIEFENYIEKCKQFAAERFDINIPDADRT